MLTNAKPINLTLRSARLSWGSLPSHDESASEYCFQAPLSLEPNQLYQRIAGAGASRFRQPTRTVKAKTNQGRVNISD
jgi:hypothetical protein